MILAWTANIYFEVSIYYRFLVVSAYFPFSCVVWDGSVDTPAAVTDVSTPSVKENYMVQLLGNRGRAR